MKRILSFFLPVLLHFGVVFGQGDTTVYHLTIKREKVNKAGKDVSAMTVNGGIPGPTLTFTEGDYAVIYVHNEMDVETSVHWHGILLPNFQDGVPYLTTPPILPGTTHKFEFRLKQSGTYWYHSHTLLQEQRGVFGSLMILPKEQRQDYDTDFVLMLSDWTNQQAQNVLRNLKRGNEWYDIKKGTAVPLNRVIARGAFGSQLKFWRQYMESADIADVYYNAFLSNGQNLQEYPQFRPGERVRLRLINGSSSSQFWVTIGGTDALLISADGTDVVPVTHNKTFIAIAETYDLLLTIPDSGRVEIRAMAQDGSGTTITHLGEGPVLAAAVVPRPDKIRLMQQMGKMDMKMGAPAMKSNPKKEEPRKMMHKWGMQKHADSMGGMSSDMSEKGMDSSMQFNSQYNYDFLRALEETSYPSDKPVQEMTFNLTGNMWRYIWSINGVPLSETDEIEMQKGAIIRITLNNLSMMHHPMHLHGHFFRVLNKNGSYSPMKHTVNVPPMQKIVIEFDNSEAGSWFFHCHVLYHMMSGMARSLRYDTIRDPRLAGFPVRKFLNDGNRFYTWGTARAASHMASVNLVSSNIRNQFNLKAEYGWNKNLEAEFSYERYIYDYFRVFAGINTENETRNSLQDMQTTAVVGIRYLTPYMFNLDVRVDNLARTQIGLSRSFMVLPRTMIFGEVEYQSDYGLVNDLSGTRYHAETTWSAGVSYFLSRNFSLMASYDNRFGYGGGVLVRF